MKMLLALLSIAAMTLSPGAFKLDHADVAMQDTSGVDRYPVTRYRGGHSAQPNAISYGVLILRNSGITYHKCGFDCKPTTRSIGYDSVPVLTIKYSELRQVASAIRSPTAVDRFALGSLAAEAETVVLVYETALRSEAPVFTAPKNMSAAIDAQIRFRAKKVGVTIPPACP